MNRRKSSGWGVIPFAAALLWCGGLLWLLSGLVSGGKSALSEENAWVVHTGLVASGICILIAHFSYPRVHNLRVYLTGYLTGGLAVLYFLQSSFRELYSWAVFYDNLSANIFILAGLNLAAACLCPPYLKYRWVKRVTWIVLLAEVFVLTLPQYLDLPMTAFLREWKPGEGFPWWSPGVLLLIVVLSYFRLKGEFYLGGIIGGLGLLYYSGWVSPWVLNHPEIYEVLVMASVPAFYSLGVIWHGFTRMEHRVAYDPMMHIYNRAFCDRIISEQSRVKTVPPFSVAMLDIDHFKKVNDTHGHQAGDRVLIEVAELVLKETVPQGIVCRYGGEEIIVFFPDTKLKAAVERLDRLRTRISRKKISTGKKNIKVTLSAGVAERKSSSESISKTIERADKVLYKAKKNGRNRVCS